MSHNFHQLSLKTAQFKAVNRMLAFNEEIEASSGTSNGGGSIIINDSTSDNIEESYVLPPAGSSHNQWKILIYDRSCQSIISPLLNVSQLRRRGVTLHLLINSEREAIPDVPAIYFVKPTIENLQIIAADCSKGLYARSHINFVTKLSREKMEDFARLVIQSESLSSIASIHDQYIDYICYEKHLFALTGIKNSYYQINNHNVTEAVISQLIEDISYGLFSVIATIGQIPIIRCPKGGAPEMIARKLNSFIMNHPTLLQKNKSSIASSKRPLVVIMDRNSDLITPIQHSSTYQALIDDLLKQNTNRVEFDVKIEEEGRRPKVINKKFDLDADVDPFYSQHKFNPFPEAIDANQSELQEVSMKEQQIRSKTVGGPGAQAHQEQDATGDLALAVDSLPVLLNRKKQLEVHTSILQAVMNEVAARDVPQFYELESSLATGTYKNDVASGKTAVLELVTDPTKGNVEDKIRLVLVFALSTKASMTDIDEIINEMKHALETKGIISAKDADGPPKAPPRGGMGMLTKEQKDKLMIGLHSIEYIKKLRSMNMISTTSMGQELSSDGDMSSGTTSSMFNLMKSATNQATGLLAKATEKVGSMLGKIHKHHTTVVVENLCEMKNNTEDDDYLYLDPKVKGDVDIATLKKQSQSTTTPGKVGSSVTHGGGHVGGVSGSGFVRAPVHDVIVFMVGGGCYSEYQNLQMLSASVGGAGRSVSYGSTELINPCEFLSQLGQLA